MDLITELKTKEVTKEEFKRKLASASSLGAQAVEGMIDSWPCGGAWLLTGGRNELIKYFKKFGEKDINGDLEVKDEKENTWRISKWYQGGYSIHCYTNKFYQNMDMDIAKYTTISKILATDFPGAKTYVHSYID